jgi:nitrite reductase (NADH) large subunit
MAEDPVIEIREPGLAPRRVVLDRAIEVGRECDGELLNDPGVSRVHLKLVPSPTSLSIVDMGSRNGTLLNGNPVTGRATLDDGDIGRLGATEIVIIGRPPAPSPLPSPASRGTVALHAVQAPVAIPAPPVPEPEPVPVSAGRSFMDRVLGRTVKEGQPVFANYMELPSRVPLPVWRIIRVVSMLTYVTLCVALFIRPAGGEFAFFKVIVPLLPITFFVAPGLWRNICPLAASNQTPRWLGFTRGLTTPEWMRKRGYIIAIILFFGITGARLALFNTSAKATGVLLSITIVSAFLMGLTFKGKSGWCSSICPLLPLQRVYGQTPFLTVPNSHCEPCVACTKNCYDFKPRVAYQADLHDPDPGWSQPRKLFAAALPGFVLGFFVILHTTTPLNHVQIYERLALFFIGSIGSFFALDALLPIGSAMLTALYGAIAINLFYWYGSLTVDETVEQITGHAVPWLRWPVRAIVLVLSLIWLARTRVAEQLFEEASRPAGTPIKLSAKGAKALAAEKDNEAAADQLSVAFDDGGQVAAAAGLSLLEVCERNGKPIESGCRMGVCGADPIAVLEGMSCLSAPEEEEVNTLRRLGYADTTRMACCARLQDGPVTMSLTPQAGDPSASKPTEYDRRIASVVVIGNGIAGVTAADFIRRGHPDCEIHLVGGESHVLYNRMGISRLVYGRSAMQGLFLLAEQWYDEHDITIWLNTVATGIDLATRRVFLGTHDTLSYDRLVLAMGSSSSVPPIEGFGTPGSFVMREAGDAINIRSYAQRNGVREAVVAGGGLLGLEAAHSLHELGLHVTVLERGDRLLSRQIDARASEIVHAYFEAIGMTVLYGAETVALQGDPVNAALLKDGRVVPCGVFLGAIGIRPNTELAAEAGLTVNRGVVVDDRMETSTPGVYAAGDVAEHNGMLLGLWPIAAKQGEVAAMNALGGSESLTAEVPACILKGAGIDLSSIGRFEPEEGEELIVVDNGAEQSYRRMVIGTDRLIRGGLVVGDHPEDFSVMLAAIKKQLEVTDAMGAALRAGDWSVLKAGAAQPAGV